MPVAAIPTTQNNSNSARLQSIDILRGAIIIFIVAGCITTYLQPVKPGALPFLFRLLNQKKYPPTQLFLLMTLGPLIACVPLAERAKGWFADVLRLFGRVPMFYYLLHIWLIHISALTVNLITVGNAHQDWYNTAPFTEIEEPNRWSLRLLYLTYIIDLVILYFACWWYSKYKVTHPEKRWLKYL